MASHVGDERLDNHETTPNVLIIVPTYNERENIRVLGEKLLAFPGFRLVVVDDASPDGTADIADELARQFPNRVVVLRRTGERGYGMSLVDGFRVAIADGAPIICQMDADLSHDPQYLPSMIQASEKADLVIGSRYLNGVSVVNWPLRRLILSVMANQYVRFIIGTRVQDTTSGFRCWRRDTLAALPLERLRSSGYAFLVETLFEAQRCGGCIGEVPIVFIERRDGASKMSWQVVVESVFLPWRLRWRRLWRR
jgi:dolichol-phosphate mannosyltransferase